MHLASTIGIMAKSLIILFFSLLDANLSFLMPLKSNSVLKPWTECELLMKFHNETSPPSPTPTTKLKKPLHLGFFAGRDTLTELLDQEGLFLVANFCA